MATPSKPQAKPAEPAKKPVTPIEVQQALVEPQPVQAEQAEARARGDAEDIHEGDTDGRHLGRWRRELPVVEPLTREFRSPWYRGGGLTPEQYDRRPPLVRAEVRSWSMSGNS